MTTTTTHPSGGVFALTYPRTVTPLARIHRQERYQPVSTRAAVRDLLRTQTYKLMHAISYLNGVATGPVRVTKTTTGQQFIDDGHRGRLFTLAAAVEHIENLGLNPNTVLVMRGGVLDDEEAFAVLVSGLTPPEAGRCAMSPDDLPPLDTLYALAALRGFDTTRN